MMNRSKSSDSEPFAVALRLLNRRDHSEAELREKLARFGFSAPAVDQAIRRCRDYNYLDDQRFALERARSLLRSGRGVGRKILLDLRHRGIAEELAEQALARAENEFSPGQLLQNLLERRFPGFAYRQADARERRRVVNFLQRRGFSLEQIFSLFNSEEE